MKNLGIWLNLTSLDVTGRNATGELSLFINNQYFPEQHWNDLIIAVLAIWISQVERLNRNQSEKEHFYFMDGAFSFEILKEGELIDIHLFGGSKENNYFRGLVWADFYNALHEKSKQLVDAYFKLTNKTNTDILTLCSYLKYEN